MSNDLLTEDISSSVISYSFAQTHKIVIGENSKACFFTKETSATTLYEIQRIFGSGLDYIEVSGSFFDKNLESSYRQNTKVINLSLVNIELAALVNSTDCLDSLINNDESSPIIRLINDLLIKAVQQKASDLHFEVNEKKCSIRFRVDGVLHDVIEPVHAVAPLLINRIKVMAQLDIAEKRLPQDGRVTLRVGGNEIDIRVSTIPAQHGERIVLRLLERDTNTLDLSKIGMSSRDSAMLKRILKRPHGMILVTGPTGSGKTTTLYSALHYLNDRKRNIMTVEDPIEYEIEGIGQMQVNPRIKLDFAQGLRAILRQDPDVIMIGEIRDHETAQMAVRSSMTGHFVLSTLHTNNAVSSIARLTDMGVERYLLAPVLAGLIAQRLVRLLCLQCRRPDKASASDSAIIGGALLVGEPIFHASGCSACEGEGYRGRTGIYEIVEIDADMQALIHDGAPQADLVAAARRAGPGLIEDGVAKIRAGLTSAEEIARVVQGNG